jgi:hypothetical protein
VLLLEKCYHQNDMCCCSFYVAAKMTFVDFPSTLPPK